MALLVASFLAMDLRQLTHLEATLSQCKQECVIQFFVRILIFLGIKEFRWTLHTQLEARFG